MSNIKTKNLVGTAILAAIVIVLQYVAIVTRTIGVFSFSFVLVPIVIGAAVYGVASGAFLGFVFGLAVLISGDAAAFMAVNIPGTILTVLLKGTACGLVSGAVYKLLENKNRYAAVIASAIVCPLVNTGIFVLGCFIFFMDTIQSWSIAANHSSAISYIFIAMIGINFIVELALNIVFVPTITHIIKAAKKS